MVNIPIIFPGQQDSPFFSVFPNILSYKNVFVKLSALISKISTNILHIQRIASIVDNAIYTIINRVSCSAHLYPTSK